MSRHLLPALAAATLVVAGPGRERLELVHAPRVVLLFALAAALLASGRLARRDFGAREWCALGAFGAMLASSLFATSPAYALLPLGLAAAALALLLGTAHRSGERETWLSWLAGAVVAVAVLGLLEVLAVGPASLRGRAPSGPMGQRNALAHVLLLGSPLLWALALRAAARWQRALWWCASALVAAVIVTTRSRAAWVGFVPTALVFLGTTRSVRPLLVAVAGAAVALASPTLAGWRHARPYVDTFTRLVDWRTGSGAGRLAEWKASLSLWAESPLLGFGPGQWFVEYGVVHRGGHFAHSDLVGLLFERGLLGVALLLGLAGATVHRWRGTRDFPLVLSTLIAGACVGLFDAVLQLPAPLVLVSCIACVGARPGASPHRDRVLAGPFALASAWSVSATASLVLATSASIPLERLELAATLNPLDGELRQTLAEAWTSAGEPERARPHHEALRRLLPRHPWLAVMALKSEASGCAHVPAGRAPVKRGA